MRKISPQVRNALLEEKDICAFSNEGTCGGRITWEHCLTNAGRQIDEVWAIIKLCERHHSVGMYQDYGLLNKEKNVWVALNRATDEELLKYSKAVNYIEKRRILNTKYGVYICG